MSLALPGLSPALPGLSPALPGAPRLVVGAPRLVVGAPRLVVGAPSYSEGRQECPPNVFYRVTAHHGETDHLRALFIDPNDLS